MLALVLLSQAGEAGAQVAEGATSVSEADDISLPAAASEQSTLRTELPIFCLYSNLFCFWRCQRQKHLWNVNCLTVAELPMFPMN